MTKWNWFLSADVEGKWLVTSGAATLYFGEDEVTGELLFVDGDGTVNSVYASLCGQYVSDNEVVMTVTHGGDHSFDLDGKLYETNCNAGARSTIILTDGATVLGLSKC